MFFLRIAVFFLVAFNAGAKAQVIQSPVTKVNVLEVYTSQGCSSCPPAEHWLNQFEDDPRLWSQFIPLNFHVDYWDYLGWKDPFSSPVFTDRQRLYQQLGLAKTIATPGFVLNGQGWNGWFYQQELPITQIESEGVITAELNQKEIDIVFDLKKESTQLLNVHVAVLGFNIVTKITRGENRGKELVHDFVVLGYKNQLMDMAGKLGKSQMRLPDVHRIKSPKQAVVIWVSSMDDPAPIQAAGGWIDAN